MTEKRIASHPDDPAAPLADRLLLALGMWPSYIDELGGEPGEAVIEAAVLIRTQAHLYSFAAEDFGTARDEADRLREALKQISKVLQEVLVAESDPGEEVSLSEWITS
jgi:hypothetical protein